MKILHSKIFTILLLSFIFISTINAQEPPTSLTNPGVPLQAPSLCSVYVKQIYEDIQHYGNGVKDQSLAWKSVGALKNVIGPGETTPSVTTTYRWKDYMMQTRDNKIVNQGGTLPSGTLPANPSVDEVIKVLGTPKITTVELQRTTWKCSDNQSSVSMLTDAQGQLLQVEATNCPPPSPQAAPATPQNPAEILGGCASAGAVLSGVVNNMPLPP